MKKLFSISLLFSVTAMMFTGCVSEEDDLFDTSAAERLMQSKKTYTERLGGSTWAMEFYPLDTDEAPKGSGYLILNQFKKDGSVIQAMQNELSDGKFLTDTSLWEVISDQGTVLTFNTFNKCIHTFSDPGLYQTGQGYEGDYEFVILSLEENAKYGMLKGKKRGTYNRLTRLPDDTDFEEYLKDVVAFQNKIFSASAPNDCMLAIGDSTFVITDTSDGIVSMYPEGGDDISETTDHAFIISKNDGKYYFRFREELAAKDSKVQELVYDEAQDMFVGVDDPACTIQGYPMGKFFGEYVENVQGRTWKVTASNQMSEKFAVYYDNLKNQFSEMKDKRNRSYTFMGLSFGYNTRAKAVVWNVMYRSPGSSNTVLAAFKETYVIDGDKVTFTYIEPADDSDANVKNALSSITDVLEVLSQQYQLSAATTKFNLSKIKLTAVNDSSIWFETNI